MFWPFAPAVQKKGMQRSEMSGSRFISNFLRRRNWQKAKTAFFPLPYVSCFAIIFPVASALPFALPSLVGSPGLSVPVVGRGFLAVFPLSEKTPFFTMLPTIDFSLIGVVLAIWQVLKFVFTHLLTALEWVSHKMIAVLVSSKIWGTIFFFGLFVSFSLLLNKLLSYCSSKIAAIVISSIPQSNVRKSFEFISQLSPFTYVADIFTFFVSCFVNYRIVQQYAVWYCRIRHMYTSLSRAWKL